MKAYIPTVVFMVLSVIIHTTGNLQSAKQFARNPDLYTSFYLYTSLRFKDAQVLPIYNDKVLKVSRFNPSFPTRILIHNFNGSKDDEFNRYMQAAYILHEHLNVIVVDWSMAVTLDAKDMHIAARNTLLVGQVIANFIDFLHTTLKYPAGSIYLVGYGLGAHAAGFAGKMLLYKPIGVIFALDPSEWTFLSGLKFLPTNSTNRLASTDADYVEVLHTNYLNHGTLQKLGHADFYANGGGSQPGCTLRKVFCSHQRAYKILAESINNPTGFKAKRCENVRQATGIRQCAGDEGEYYVGGEPARSEQEGIFSFKTGTTDPYTKI